MNKKNERSQVRKGGRKAVSIIFYSSQNLHWLCENEDKLPEMNNEQQQHSISNSSNAATGDTNSAVASIYELTKFYFNGKC